MKTAPTSDEILFSLLYSRTGPRRALSLKLSDTRVYEPEKQEISEESVSSPNPMSCSDTHTPKPSRQHPHPPTHSPSHAHKLQVVVWVGQPHVLGRAIHSAPSKADLRHQKSTSSYSVRSSCHAIQGYLAHEKLPPPMTLL